MHVALAAPAPVNASVFSGGRARANPADVDASSGRRARRLRSRAADEPDETIGFATLEETTFTPRVAVTSAPATVAYAVLRRGSRAPTPAQILAGLDASGLPPLDRRFGFREDRIGIRRRRRERHERVRRNSHRHRRGKPHEGNVVRRARGGGGRGRDERPGVVFPPSSVARRHGTVFPPGVSPRDGDFANRDARRSASRRARGGVGGGRARRDARRATVRRGRRRRRRESMERLHRDGSDCVAEANATSSEGLSAVVVAVAVAVADERLGVGDDSRVRPVQLILSGLNPDTKYEVYAAARKYHPGVNGDAPATIGAAQSAAARIAAATPASVARLVSLVASVGTFVPEFDPETTEYALKIPDPPGVAMPWPTAALAAVAGDARWFVEADGAPLAPGGDDARVRARRRRLASRRTAGKPRGWPRFADGTDDVSRARVARHVGGGDARGGRDARAAARRDGRRRVVKRHANGRRRVARMYPRVRPGGHRRVPFGAKAMRDGPRSTRVSIDRLDRRDDRDGDGGDARAKRHGEVHRRRRRRRRGARHARGGGEDGDASGCRRCRPEGGEC